MSCSKSQYHSRGIEFHTWVGSLDGQEICNITPNKTIYHCVSVTNYRGDCGDLTFKGQTFLGVKGRPQLKFETGSGLASEWIVNISIDPLTAVGPESAEILIHYKRQNTESIDSVFESCIFPIFSIGKFTLNLSVTL
jgi:hypothetical protein